MTEELMRQAFKFAFNRLVLERRIPMVCDDCCNNMLLEYSSDGVEVYTCPYCGSEDSIDMKDYGSEYDE